MFILLSVNKKYNSLTSVFNLMGCVYPLCKTNLDPIFYRNKLPFAKREYFCPNQSNLKFNFIQQDFVNIIVVLPPPPLHLNIRKSNYPELSKLYAFNLVWLKFAKCFWRTTCTYGVICLKLAQWVYLLQNTSYLAMPFVYRAHGSRANRQEGNR